MLKGNDLKRLSFNKYDILALIYFFFIVNQGINIEALRIGRLKLLEIIPLFFLAIISFQNIFSNFNKIFKIIYLFLFVLLLFSIVASTLQESIKPFLYVFMFILLSVSCLNFGNNSDVLDKNILKLFKYIIFINFFILLSCLLFGDTKYIRLEGFYRFKGIFDNSNQLGRFCSISLVLSLFPLFENYLKLNKGYKFICIFNLCLSLILLSYSNSRLSFLVVFVGFFTFALLNAEKILNFIHKIFFKKSFIIKSIYISIFVSFIIFFIIVTNEAWIDILNKFIDSPIRDHRGGLTAYRYAYISSSLDYLNFFGYKNFKYETTICSQVLTHYAELKQYKACDVHNTYLNIWLKYGAYFAFFIFYGLVLILLFSLNFSRDEYKYAFLSRLVTVLTVSLLVYYFFETGILHIFLILDLILISYLIKRKISKFNLK